MEESPTPIPEVTVEEAVSLAIRLQKNQQLAEAAELYRRILELVPDYPNALHYSGVLAHQQGRSDEGISLIERSLTLEPGQADWYSNLGIVLQDRSKLDDAIVAYQRAIALDPNHANAHNNLGVLLRAQGRPVEAETAYRTAIRLNPDRIDAYTNLGILLTGQKRMQEAVACFCKVITLRPKHPEARRLLALAHCTIGEVDKAVKIFEDWLDEEPEEPIARHMLAACSGQGVPARASDGFIEKIFDSFAASFDSKLTKLSYRAPALVAAMLADLTQAPKSLDVLDAGCGTGLCGPLVAPFARRLVGVDLSAGMLAQAKEKHVYDDLVKSELTAYLREHKEAFDVILSADTLVYFGTLEEIVAVAAAALRSNGLLIFTLEEATDGESTKDYRLAPHG
ncbi:MAG: tetratricopeptide repeat protein, partial [Luteitalea sp.]|nr:tetratricopeptide repeat protein [Luteitalea sp.]